MDGSTSELGSGTDEGQPPGRGHAFRSPHGRRCGDGGRPSAFIAPGPMSPGAGTQP